MFESMRLDRGSQMARAAANVFRVGDDTPSRPHSDGLPYVGTFPVRVYWLIRRVHRVKHGLGIAAATLHPRRSPLRRVEEHIAFQPQSVGIQSDGDQR